MLRTFTLFTLGLAACFAKSVAVGGNNGHGLDYGKLSNAISATFRGNQDASIPSGHSLTRKKRPNPFTDSTNCVKRQQHSNIPGKFDGPKTNLSEPLAFEKTLSEATTSPISEDDIKLLLGLSGDTDAYLEASRFLRRRNWRYQMLLDRQSDLDNLIQQDPIGCQETLKEALCHLLFLDYELVKKDESILNRALYDAIKQSMDKENIAKPITMQSDGNAQASLDSNNKVDLTKDLEARHGSKDAGLQPNAPNQSIESRAMIRLGLGKLFVCNQNPEASTAATQSICRIGRR